MLTLCIVLLSIPISIWLSAQVVEGALFSSTGRGSLRNLSLLLTLLFLSSDIFFVSLSKLSTLLTAQSSLLVIIGQFSSVFLIVSLIVLTAIGVQLSIEATGSMLLGTPKREQLILNIKALRVLTLIAFITLLSPLFVRLIVVKLVELAGVSV